MSTGMKGVDFYPSGQSQRTRDWSRPQESEKAVKPETPEQRRKREWDEGCQREAQRVQAARAETLRREDAERLRQKAEQDRKRKAEELQQRRLAYESAQFQIMAIFDQNQIGESERVAIEDKITQRDLWATPMTAVEYATVQAMEIAAKREQANQKGIAEVRSLCDDSEWERILSTIARYRSHFTDAEIADGTAHRIVHNRFRN